MTEVPCSFNTYTDQCCGNGTIDYNRSTVPEECDDGNRVNFDGCSAQCHLEACRGDCNGDGSVTVDELVTAVAIAIGAEPPSTCAAAACHEGGVTVECIVRAVGHAILGCEPPPPTSTPTPTSTRPLLTPATPALRPTCPFPPLSSTLSFTVRIEPAIPTVGEVVQFEASISDRTIPSPRFHLVFQGDPLFDLPEYPAASEPGRVTLHVTARQAGTSSVVVMVCSPTDRGLVCPGQANYECASSRPVPVTVRPLTSR